MNAATRVKILLPRQSQPGSHRDGGSNSASTILSTLIPILLFFLAGLAVFTFLRAKFQRVYEPRSLRTLVPQHHEAKRAEGTKLGWIKAMREIKDSDVLRQHSLDGFLYLRYLKMMAIMSFAGVCVTWPILFPVNATGGGEQSELDKLSFSNIVNANRYYAHTLIAWIFLGFLAFVITRERKFYVGLRQAYYLSPLHALRLSSRTVLFMSVPEETRTISQVRNTFPNARKVWMVPDCKDLEDMVKERDKELGRVEKAQVTKILEVYKKGSKGKLDQENPLHGISEPTHRTKPIIGSKVNTIRHSRASMTKLNENIKKTQAELLDENGKILSATFVEFENQFEANKALQFAVTDSKTKWKPRHIGVQPQEVIWKNLGTDYKALKSKMLVANVIIALMILFWTIPVAFVGVLTNINYLTTEVPFLGFINNIPSVILGVVTGLLPTILLAVLMALVPIFCRFLAKFAGAPTLTEVEMKTQNWYFAFQIVQVFLVTTFTSGAAAVAAQIVQNPPSAITLLAENLPKASNFYISYFILFGLQTTIMLLLNIAPFLMLGILGRFDKTPRKKYQRWLSLQGLGWGSVYPKFTTLGVIAITYSCIAPLILGFATVGFILLYIGFRYNFLFVYGIKVDMKGQAYCRALKQLTAGIYLAAICLIGLFAIKCGETSAAVGPLVLMIIFLVVLVVWNILMDRAFNPLERDFPIYRLETNQYSNEQAYKVEDLEKTGAEGSTQGEPSEKATIHRNDSLPAPLPTGGPTQNRTGNFLSRFAYPFIDRAFEKNKTFLESWSQKSHDMESYTAEDIDTAYQNPALAAETRPIIWLPKDQYSISTIFVRENIEAGLESTDEHAWLDTKGKVDWDREQITKCPIYEEPKLW